MSYVSMRPYSDDSLRPYRDLVEAFVSGRLAADEFQSRFFELYLNDPTNWPDPVFYILDGLFADVDAFCPDEERRKNTLTPQLLSELSETELLARCKEALRALREM